MKTVLISGYYGFNNLGDEAVLGGLVAGLRSALPEVEPLVLSADPDATRKAHGVEAIPRMNPGLVNASIREADLFISGGGSLLQDVTSFKSPLYYLGLLWQAQQAHVPTMMVGQGVGPLRNPINRFIARRILNRLVAITVRDAASADYLRALGVQKPPIEVTADLSLLLEPDHSERLETWWNEHIPAGRPVLGVALRRWKDGQAHERYTAIADSLAAFAQRTGALLLFLPMQHVEDLEMAEQMAGWTPAESQVISRPLSPQEMLAAIGRRDFVLGMRLHALIFAARMGVPGFGLAYDPKVTDCSCALGLPEPMLWEAINDAALTEQLCQHWTTRASLALTMRETVAEQTTLARRNIERIGEVLAGGAE